MEAIPEGSVVADGVEGFDEVGVEPGAAAGLGDGECGIEAVTVVEDFGGLREAEDAGEHGDIVAGEAVGVTLSVPVFVEAADGDGGFFGHGEVSGDGGAAVAAEFDEFFCGGGAGAGDAHEAGDACGEAAAGGGVAEDVAEFSGETGPVGGFDIAFDAAVIGAEEVADAGGVAGAAEVFEEECVEEGGALFGGEVDFPGEAHADDAGADGVSFGLAFGDVERVGEGGDDLGESQLGGGRGWAQGEHGDSEKGLMRRSDDWGSHMSQYCRGANSRTLGETQNAKRET